MNAIDEYIKAKESLRRFNAWAELIGKEYFGGTRGKGGEYGQVVNADGKMTVYSQAYDGANNYHDLDGDFRGNLSSAMVRHSAFLINDIRQQLETNVLVKANQAAKLTEEINSDKLPT